MSDLLFLVNESKLKNNIINYQSLGNVCFTVKTNSSKYIIKKMEELSNKTLSYGFNSKSQFKILNSIVKDKSRIFCINPCLNVDTDIIELINLNVINFTFDNLHDLSKFVFYINKNNINTNFNITLRISIEEYVNEKSYIGMYKDDITKAIKLISQYTNNINLSFYLPQTVEGNIKKLDIILNNIYEIANKYKISNIVFGGVPEFNLTKKLINKYNFNYIIEIGQNLVKDTIDLKVKISKKNNNKIFLPIGIYGGFLDKILYNKEFVFYFIKDDEIYYFKNNGDIDLYICGPTGDSKDIIAHFSINKDSFVFLKNIDFLYVKDVGYYFDNITTYNFIKLNSKNYKFYKEALNEV